MRHVLLVGHRPHALRAARSLGLEAVLLDPDGDAERACADRELVAAVALTEAAVPTAAAARAALGLAGMDRETAARCHDKALMKEAVRAAGLLCADWRPVMRAEDAEAAVGELGLPLVVKERSKSGRRGLVLARDAAEARRAAGPGRMAERFVEGVEMSVESFVAEGRLLFVNPTEYLVVAHANIVPAVLDAAVRERVEDLNRRAIAALGITRGMVHIELFLTASGPVFGEVAARPPGGRIMRLLRAVYGFDPWEALLRVECGESPAIPAVPKRAAGAWMLHPGAGRLRAVEGIEEARAVPGIRRLVCRVRAGDTVAERVGTGQDVGWIEARGPDRDAVARSLHAAHAAIRMVRTTS